MTFVNATNCHDVPSVDVFSPIIFEFQEPWFYGDLPFPPAFTITFENLRRSGITATDGTTVGQTAKFCLLLQKFCGMYISPRTGGEIAGCLAP
nr:hypothetical protein [Escherichia coli]QUN02490.1 hypothetical protein [Escherichia coli O25b:H4-ST131]